MAWGYPHHLVGHRYEDTVPLSLRPQADGAAIPRRAFEIFECGPGVLTISNRGAQITDFSQLRFGDLVFFDADVEDGPQIDHVGMYLGVDSNDRHHFHLQPKGSERANARRLQRKIGPRWNRLVRAVLLSDSSALV